MAEEWTKTSIRAELQIIAQHVQAPATAYLVGGSAMVVSGFKETTPDIDLTVTSKADIDHLEDAFLSAGLQRGVRRDSDADRGNFRRFYDDNGREVDLAHEQLGDGLLLSSGMRDRSDLFLQTDCLTVAVISPEDIYLRKIVSGRKKDLLDSKALLQAPIDTDIVAAELREQEAMLDRELPSVLAFDGSREG